MKYHLKPIRKAEVRQSANTKCYQGVWGNRRPRPLGCDCNHLGEAEDMRALHSAIPLAGVFVQNQPAKNLETT